MKTSDCLKVMDNLKRTIAELEPITVKPRILSDAEPTQWDFKCLGCGHGFNSEQAKVIEEPHMWTVTCPKCGLSEIEDG